MKRQLSISTFSGYVSSVARSLLQNVMAYGSQNGIINGLGFIRAFRGFQSLNPLTNKGSHQFFQTDSNFVGLGDESVHGKGSVFKVQRVLCLIGTGQLRINGQNTSVSANSTLQYLKKSGGAFVSPAYQAGHARPSSQTIYAKTPSAGKTAMSGAVATVIWRVDSTTGQVSLASFPSNVLILNNQTVIQQFPAVDSNGQDIWGIGVPKIGFGADGVMYQLKTELGGEVLESTLAYTRTTGTASIADGTNVVNDAGGNFSASDVGRRYAFSTFDSWITEVVSTTQVKVNDTNTSGSTISGSGTIRHAVDGILRAVEIGWTSTDLIGQDLAPFDAYPPPSNLSWGGIINDTLFVETDEGIIFVGVPGYIGSFPPKNTMFPAEPATLYLDGSDGVYWRFSKHTLSVITYIGGTKPLEMQLVWKNAGVLYPQNAAIGMGGRVIAWIGKPVRLGAGRDPEVDFALEVYKDFADWVNSEQYPVICEYDKERQLEIWAWKDKIMCLYVPTGKWCSPIKVAPLMANGEYLVSAVSVDDKVRFTTNNGSALIFRKFDEGNGSTFICQTTDTDSALQHDTITEIQSTMHVSNGDAVTIKIIKDYDDANPITVGTDTISGSGTKHFKRFRPNITNAKSHAVAIEIVTSGGDSGVEKIEVLGDSSNVFIG